MDFLAEEGLLALYPFLFLLVEIVIRLVVLVASLHMSGLATFGTYRRAFVAVTPNRVEALPEALSFEALFSEVFS